MGFLSNLFTKPAQATVGEIFKGIDGLTTSNEERSRIKLEAIQVMLQAQSAVLVAEAQSGTLARSWRPLAMLSFVGMLWWYVLSTSFGFVAPDLSTVPADLWTLITVGLGGYVGGRTVEKIATTVAMTKRQSKKIQPGA